jgi:hypothetical protein
MGVAGWEVADGVCLFSPGVAAVCGVAVAHSFVSSELLDAGLPSATRVNCPTADALVGLGLTAGVSVGWTAVSAGSVGTRDSAAWSGISEGDGSGVAAVVSSATASGRSVAGSICPHPESRKRIAKRCMNR